MTMQIVAETWMREAVAVTWQFSVLAAITWVLLKLLGHRLSPGARYLIWLFVLLRLLAPIGFESPWGITGHTADFSTLSTPAVTLSGAPAVSTAVGSASTLEKALHTSVCPEVVVFAVWAILTMLLILGWWIRIHRSGRRLRRSWLAVPEALQREIDLLGGEVGLKGRIRARLVPDHLVRGPGIFGVLRPHLILPESFRESNSKEMRAAIVLHELAHILRRDHLLQPTIVALQILYFFNPLVWMVARLIRLEREAAVDDLVISAIGEVNRKYYAELLLHFAVGSRAEAVPAVGMAAPRSQVGRRLVRLLAEDYVANSRSRRSAVCLVFLCMLATLAFAAGAAKTADDEDVGGPEVRAVVVWHRAEILVDGQASWVDTNGDFQLGRPVAGSLQIRSKLADLPEQSIAHLADGAILGTTIDKAGRPGEIRVIRSAQAEVDRILVEGLKTARFEPTRYFNDTPVRVEITVNFRLAEDVPPSGPAQRVPAIDNDIESVLEAAYSLDAGEGLRLLSPPHDEKRLQFYRLRAPQQAALVPEGPDMMVIELRDGIPEYGGACFGCNTIAGLLGLAGHRDSRLLGDQELLGRTAHADILIDRSAPKDVVESDLRQQMVEHFGLQLNDVIEEKTTIVLRGQFGSIHGKAEVDGTEAILVSLEGSEDDGSGGGGVANLQQFANLLEGFIGIPVEIEGVPEKETRVQVRLHRSAYQTKRVQKLLKVIESQCDLTLSLENRPVRMLLVEEMPD